MLRVAVVGALGRQGQRRLDAVSQVPGASVSWVVGRPGTRLRLEEEARHRACRASSSWRDAVDDPATDLVVVCTPNNTHAEIAIGALQQGKHVLVEKPLANTLHDAQRMAEASRVSSCLLKTGFNYPLRPVISKALEHVRSGAIGDLTVMRAAIGHSRFSSPQAGHTWFHDSHQVGRGALLDLGIHVIDLGRRAVRAFGDEFESVIAMTRSTARYGAETGIELDDAAIATYRTVKGRLLAVHASWLEVSERLVFRWTLLGTEGRIETDLATKTTTLFRVVSGKVAEQVSQFASHQPDQCWRDELALMRDAIAEGTRVDGDAEAGLAAQQLIFMAYESAAGGGGPIKVH